MRLYHGSTVVVEHPLVHKSRGNLDFGRGFYLTSYRDQAIQWAKRKGAFEGVSGVVNEYDFDCVCGDLRVLKFDAADAAWVEFVCGCRKGSEEYRDYDIIVGGVADDKVYFAVDMYLRGLWDMSTTLSALKYYKVNDQWCFVNQNAVDLCLSFAASWEVDTNETE